MVDVDTLQNKQEKFISQGGLTNSKFRGAFCESTPTHLKSAQGPYVFDHRGVRYIDLICGLGPISIGHCHPYINSAVLEQVNEGVSFSLPTHHEVVAAEFLLTEFLPTYDAVKYLKTGAEATSGAVTIARSATGRQWILTQGYHGHHANWMSVKPNHHGIRDFFSYRKAEDINDLLERPLDDVAAVILEPIHLEHSEANTQKLFRLKEKCRRAHTLLIFDEIVCGARIPEVFISKIIEPDLICIGKGIANGFPIAAIVGKKYLMHETPFFISSTFGGEALSLVAHLKTLQFIKNNPIKEMYESANRLMKKAQDLLSPYVELKGYGTRGYFDGQFGLMQQEAIKAKLLIGRSWYYNYSHWEIEKVILSALEDIAQSLPKASLQGRSLKEVFKRA